MHQVLALEYAVRYPERASRLILMNPAPVSNGDFKLLRQEWVEKRPEDRERRRAIAATGSDRAADGNGGL